VAANAVHRQHEALADELGAQMPARAQTPIEAMILGDEESPQVDEDLVPVPTPVRAAAVPRTEPIRSPEPVAEPGRFFGLFGRKKKDEPRMEPVSRPAQRPAAQTMARPPAAAPAEAPRPQQPPQNSAEDLFPDHKRDEQFEIPAFLRRQTN
jgi:cell division protein FtsZ